MTGFGNATVETDVMSVSVELRAVNNRYLKISTRLPDSLGRFESRIEKLIRNRIARGSVQLSLRVRFPDSVRGWVIDAGVLSAYRQQLDSLQESPSIGVETKDLLMLPGVVVESEPLPELVDSIWSVVEQAVADSLTQFDQFRKDEGRSMEDDLRRQCRVIIQLLDAVAEQAPQVVAEYRKKLLERVTRAIQEIGVSVEQKDVMRDVAIFADRCDINEEITRLRSHLDQFTRFLNSDQSMGRKLEFLGQEMFREINTIGSKANNVVIAHSVVDMKAAIERIREILQNVE